MSINSSVASKLSRIHTMKHCATVKMNDTEICALIKDLQDIFLSKNSRLVALYYLKLFFLEINTEQGQFVELCKSVIIKITRTTCRRIFIFLSLTAESLIHLIQKWY